MKRNCSSERSQKMLLNYVLAFANDAPAVLREKVTLVNVETSCFSEPPGLARCGLAGLCFW